MWPHAIIGVNRMPKKRVLILCTANSARSQMAHGLLNQMASDRFEVFSAGTTPSSVNPYAIRAMQQIEIDIRYHTSDSLQKYLDQPFDYVITVCDKAAETCPIFPGPAIRLHWGFPDPAAVEGTDEVTLSSFADVRDGLKTKLQEWLSTNP